MENEMKIAYSLPDFAKENNNFLSTVQVSPFTNYSNSLTNSDSPFLTLGNGFRTNAYLKANDVRRTFTAKGPTKKAFFCDSCNKGFSEQNELQKHLSEHIKCDVDNCSFKGHPKIVELHKKLQHDTGLARKIMRLDDPEEIRKWKEERRKNFPTAANIARRKAEQEEKEARGEVLHTKQFGKMKRKQWNHNKDEESFSNKKRRRRHRRRPKSRSLGNSKSNEIRKPCLQNKLQPFSLESENNKTNGLKKFEGILLNKIEVHNDEDQSDLIADIDSESEFSSNSDNDCINNREKHHSLSRNYGMIYSDTEIIDLDDTSELAINSQNIEKSKSSDFHCKVIDNIELNSNSTATLSYFNADTMIEDSDDEKPIVQKIIKTETENIQIPSIGGALGNLMIAYEDSEEEPERTKQQDITKSKEVEKTKPTEVKENDNSAKQQNNRSQNRKIPPRHYVTILEKLLATEIRHERNVIMQCVHHIVKNNFFE